MLKSIYTDQSTALPESSRMYEILGLNLLFLLSQNRLGDFHTELELLPPDILLSNPYIENPVQLEQFIMEGKYNKVIDTRYNVPAESYKFFIDVLLETIRIEIGMYYLIMLNFTLKFEKNIQFYLLIHHLFSPIYSKMYGKVI